MRVGEEYWVEGFVQHRQLNASDGPSKEPLRPGKALTVSLPHVILSNDAVYLVDDHSIAKNLGP